MRYFIEIAYDGHPYHGWQRQPHSISVQEVLEHALSTLLRCEQALTGAGRTDAGVHAMQLFAHFDFDENFSNAELKNLQHRLNRFLPESIAVNSILRVTDEAHARFDACKRRYEYKIHQQKSPFLNKHSYFFEKELDVNLMNTASQYLLGKQDFKCFSRSNTDVKTYLCDITEAHWKIEGNLLVFTIAADRFLRNMVRAVVGTLIEVGLGKLTPSHIKNIIESRERSNAGASAPAHGLYLTAVEYPQEIFKVDGRRN